MLNNVDYEFHQVMSFIRKLKDMTTHEQGAGMPFEYLYRDEFVLLEKFVRRGYYGTKGE